MTHFSSIILLLLLIEALLLVPIVKTAEAAVPQCPISYDSNNVTHRQFRGVASMKFPGGRSEFAFSTPAGIIIDDDGNIVLCERRLHVIRKIDTAGRLTTFAGSMGSSGNRDYPSPRFSSPSYIALDRTRRNYLISDFGNSRIRIIYENRTVGHYAGSVHGYTGRINDPDPTKVLFYAVGPLLTTITTGVVLICDVPTTAAPQIRVIDENMTVNIFAGGKGTQILDSVDPLEAKFSRLAAIAENIVTGNIYVSDTDAIRMIDRTGAVKTIVAPVRQPFGIVPTSSTGKLVIITRYAVQLISFSANASNFTSQIIAGNVETAGFTNPKLNDPTAARFGQMLCLTMDRSGNLLISDYKNSRIRMVYRSGLISQPCSCSDMPDSYSVAVSTTAHRYPKEVGILASKIEYPRAVIIDHIGNIVMTSSTEYVVRILYASGNGTAEVLAGRVGVSGFQDNVDPLQASFSTPVGLSLDPTGENYLVSDHSGAIRIIYRNGTVSTFAGIKDRKGFRDDANPLAALFQQLTCLMTTLKGSVMVCDPGNYRLGIIYPNMTVSTFHRGSSWMLSMYGIAEDQRNGNIFVCVGTYLTVFLPNGTRRDSISSSTKLSAFGFLITASNEIIATVETQILITPLANLSDWRIVAGTGARGYNDAVDPLQAKFGKCRGIALDKNGNLLIADAYNRMIRIMYQTGYVAQNCRHFKNSNILALGKKTETQTNEKEQFSVTETLLREEARNLPSRTISQQPADNSITPSIPPLQEQQTISRSQTETVSQQTATLQPATETYSPSLELSPAQFFSEKTLTRILEAPFTPEPTNSSMNNHTAPVIIHIEEDPIAAKITKAEVTVVTASTASAVVVDSFSAAAFESGAAGNEMQSIVVLGLMQCSKPGMKKLTGDARRAITPFSFGESSLGRLYGNLLIAFVALALHSILVLLWMMIRKASIEKSTQDLRFPSLSLTVMMLTYQGSTFEASVAAFDPEEATGNRVLAAVILTGLVVIPLLGAWWFRAKCAVEYWPYQHVFRQSSALLKRLVYPHGRWNSQDPIKHQYGFLFGSLPGKGSWWMFLLPFLQAFIISLLAGVFRGSLCELQAGILCFVFFCTALAIVLLQPYRLRFSNSGKAVINFCTGLVAAGGFYKPLESIVSSLLITISVLSVGYTICRLSLSLLEKRWKKIEKREVAAAQAMASPRSNADDDGDGDGNTEQLVVPLLSLNDDKEGPATKKVNPLQL